MISLKGIDCIRVSFVYIFCLVSTRLSFSHQSVENKVLNIESAFHNELSLKI